MEPGQQSSAYQVQSGAQATAFQHLLRPWLLLACAREARKLGDLADELRQPLAKLHYHLGRLLDSGLLRVDRIEPRQGRPIKYYKAIAEAFEVSLADVREQVSEGLTRELRRSISSELARRNSHLRYHLDASGRPGVTLLSPEGHRPTERALDHWKVMRLTPELRTALAAEITALIARYEQASADGELFLVHAAFAPKQPL